MITEERRNTIREWVTALTNNEVEFAHTQTLVERNRRRNREIVDLGVAEAITELRDAGVLATPGEDAEPPQWEDPGTIHTRMYLLGDVVTHDGKTYRSTHPGLNHWQPGAPGIDYCIWEEVQWEEDPGDGVIDFRAGVVVEPGDIVRYDGVLYEVLQAHTMADHWPPDALPAMYRPI